MKAISSQMKHWTVSSSELEKRRRAGNCRARARFDKENVHSDLKQTNSMPRLGQNGMSQSPPVSNTPAPVVGAAGPSIGPSLTPATAFDMLKLISPPNNVSSPGLVAAATPGCGAESGVSPMGTVGADGIGPAECLSLGEEAKLRRYFEAQMSHICDALAVSRREKGKGFEGKRTYEGKDFPLEFKATALCFLKRFFLSSSIMEHDPRIILLTCLALALKSEDMVFFSTLEELMQEQPIAEFITAMKLENTPVAVQSAELRVLEMTCFHLTLHHPYRPLRGWLADLEPHCQGTSSLVEQSCRDLITQSLFSDLCFLHPPSRIALAALRSVCRKKGIVIERVLAAQLGELLPTAEAQRRATKLLDEIEERFLREASAAPSLEELQKDALWRRASKFWMLAQKTAQEPLKLKDSSGKKRMGTHVDRSSGKKAKC